MNQLRTKGTLNIQRGRRIRVLRAQRGMTQANLAEKLHVSVNAVSGWENGKAISIKHKYSLCQELNISPEVLDGDVDDLANTREFQITFLRRLNLPPDIQERLEKAINLYYEGNEPSKI